LKRCSQIRRMRERGFLEPLTLDQEFLIEQHTAGCPECARIIEREEGFDQLLHSLPDAPVERLDMARSTATIWEGIDAMATPAPRRRRHLVALVAGLAAIVSVFALAARFTADGESADPDQPLGSIAEAPDRAVELPDARAEIPPGAEDVGPPMEVSNSTSVVALEPSDLDRMRLGEARNQVRALLASASVDLVADGAGAHVLQGIIQLDESLAASLGSWPVLRIIEGFAVDPDPGVAQVALRYLGLRGDVASARVLERALHDEDLSPVAVEALCDRGLQGLSELTWAFWNTPHGGRVGDHIVQLALRDRPSNRMCLEWVRRAAEAKPGAMPGERGVDLLDRLARIEGSESAPLGDPAGLEFLFGLVADPAWRVIALDALAERPEAGEYLASTLTDEGPSYPESVRLDVTERLGWRAALPWLEETCHRGGQPEQALQVLAALDGVDVVDSLIHVRRAFGPASFARAWHRAIEHDSERFTEYAWRVVEGGGRAELDTYLELLLALAPARVVSAICAVSSSPMLADDNRERALLIAGELGQRADLDVLRKTFDLLEHDDSNLAAACLWSARQMGGLIDDASVQSWLESTSALQRRRVLELLPEDPLSGDGALRRFRLARELEPILTIRDESDRFARSARLHSIEGTTP